VGDAVLKDSIRQLREALEDDANSPRYIETAHRRGYRFIAPISKEMKKDPAIGSHSSSEAPQSTSRAKCPSSPSAAPTNVLGRQLELAQMRSWRERALQGERQIVFVTGEPGIGKTTLVNAALGEMENEDVWISKGQCVEQYGAGEAYLPVLDGLSRLCRSPKAARVRDLLKQFAPTWVSQMPSITSPGDRQPLQASREGMLREMGEAVEAMTAESPLVLVLEDLHWSDYSTLDLISFLARHRESARLMVVGTYRPVEVILSEHKLKGLQQDLQAQGFCRVLNLDYLSQGAVSQFIDKRFRNHRFPQRFARLVYRRSEGNPLFMVNLAEFLIDKDLVVKEGEHWKLKASLNEVESAVPESVKQLIEKEIERLTADERTVLEVASVVGVECSAASIAAALEKDETWVEEHCEELVRRHHFLMPARVIDAPDGSVTSRYRFCHVLYLEVPYHSIPRRRRGLIHRRVGDREESIYRERAAEIAAELAMHFEQGRDFARAVKYLLMAAENAARCSAHHEAAALARRGLSLLGSISRTPDTANQEITLQMILGVSVMATKGFASSEVEELYAASKELYWIQGPSPQLFSGLWLLGHLYFFSGKMEITLEVADQLLQLAEGLNDRALITEAELAVGATLVELGRCLEAVEHLERASSLYDTNRNNQYITFMGHDCKVVTESYAARALWSLGFSDRALERVSLAVTLSERLAHAQSMAVAFHLAAEIHNLRGEYAAAASRSQSLIVLADEYSLELWLACGNVDLGWAQIEQDQLDEGIENVRRA
jgi:predicted ATPase